MHTWEGRVYVQETVENPRWSFGKKAYRVSRDDERKSEAVTFTILLDYSFGAVFFIYSYLFK